MDTDTYGGEIIFTFDGDAAGQKAALRAFEDDQTLRGADLHRGRPGQHGPLRAAAGPRRRGRARPGRPPRAADRVRAALHARPLRPGHRRGPRRRAAGRRARWSRRSRTGALRPEYARKLAGDLGMEVEPVTRAVAAAATARPARREPRRRPSAAAPAAERPARPWWSVRRSSWRCRSRCSPARVRRARRTVYTHPVHAAVREAIAEAGGAGGHHRRRQLGGGRPRRLRRPRRQGAGGGARGGTAAARRRPRPALRDDHCWPGCSCTPSTGASPTSSPSCSASTRSPTRTSTCDSSESWSRWSSRPEVCASRRSEGSSVSVTEGRY